MTKLTLLSIGSIAMAAVLTACGGASPSSSGVASAVPVAPQVLSADAGKKCSSDHGVSVKPCFVNLTVSNPTQTVTTKGPKGGTFSVKDMSCTTKDVAEVEGTGNDYTVTAGAKSGSCNATFTDKNSNGKLIGKAQLSITNKL